MWSVEGDDGNGPAYRKQKYITSNDVHLRRRWYSTEDKPEVDQLDVKTTIQSLQEAFP